MLPGKIELRWFYGLIFAFLGTTVFCIAKEWYWIAAVPIFLGIVYLAIFSLDTILYFVAFATPLAIVLNDKSSGPALSLPTEPLLFGILLLFSFKLIFEGGYDRRILAHPISKAIYFILGWTVATCFTSTYPIVSLKHLLSQLWFIVPSYFLGIMLFKEKKNIKRFIWLYLFSLSVVIIYTITRHAQNAWTQKAAHWVMTPFYNDHTAYAAALALFVPPVIYLWRDHTNTFKERTFSGLAFILLLLALILSYTRAAWLSLVLALGLFIVYRMRIKFYWVLTMIAGASIVFFSFKTDILMKLEKNRQDSATDFNKHIQSISNISTDASNLERINRWNCAIRMWKQKPFWGWGPGTYQFNYAPFQKSSEMTIISTNAGDMGNAHSEFIGPLSEQGVLGMAAMIILVVVVIYRASIIFSRSKNKNTQRITLAILLGLVTYFIHGTMNNFLDTDKLAVPVWSFIGMIAAIDIYIYGEEKKTPPEINGINN